MLVGAFYFPTDYGMNPGDLARALEERGFESLFFFEHTQNTKSPRTPIPSGGELTTRNNQKHQTIVSQ